MPSKGTKQIRLGRIERYMKLELARIGDLTGVQEHMTDYTRGALEGRREVIQRLSECLGITLEVNDSGKCVKCGEVSDKSLCLSCWKNEMF